MTQTGTFGVFTLHQGQWTLIGTFINRSDADREVAYLTKEHGAGLRRKKSNLNSRPCSRKAEQTMPHYDVVPHPRLKRWIIMRRDQPCRIGEADSRKQAILIARMLAGWNGRVTVNRKPV
jgi:hypothetical protein